MTPLIPKEIPEAQEEETMEQLIARLNALPDTIPPDSCYKPVAIRGKSLSDTIIEDREPR